MYKNLKMDPISVGNVYAQENNYKAKQPHDRYGTIEKENALKAISKDYLQSRLPGKFLKRLHK